MSNISIERLEDLAKGKYFIAEGAYAEAQVMARELLEYRKASAEPVVITHDMVMTFEQSSNTEQLEPVSGLYNLPAGYIAVPIEPTMEMLDEFDSIIDYGAEDSEDAWRRLIAAAPKP